MEDWNEIDIRTEELQNKQAWNTVKKIRSFYGKIPGIRLPVLLPLFLRAFTCRTFLEIKIW